MRTAEDHHIQFAAVCRRQLRARRLQIADGDVDRLLRSASVKCRLHRRRLGRDARDVKQGDAAGRSDGGRERLQVVLGRRYADAFDHRDAILRQLSDEVAEHREELIVLLQRSRYSDQTKQQLAGAVLGQMKTDGGNAAGDRAADVEEIRIPFGPRADDRIGKGDRVRLAPRNLLTEGRPHRRLIRRAGPRGRRAHLFVREHLPRGLRRPVRRHGPVLPPALVDAAHVEARRNRDARAERGEALREFQRRVAEIDGAVDVRVRDVHQLAGLVEGHSHLLLHAYSETSWTDQVSREGLALRVARAVNHLHLTLMAGFTTVRDLGTEGAQYADVELKQAVNQGIVPGPRVLASTKAIVATGSYQPKFVAEWSVPQGAEEADGVDGLTRVVRDQIGKIGRRHV